MKTIKEPSAKQLAARKAFGEQAKARAAAKRAGTITRGSTIYVPKDPVIHVFTTGPVAPNEETHSDQSADDLRRQITEMQENMELMRRALLNQGTPQAAGNGLSIGSTGSLIGEVEKYTVDPGDYPDMTPRLAAEPRLASLAFDYHYELDYTMEVVPYQTKSGVNMKEPKFIVTLWRIKLDNQGNQTDQRYRARRMVFHEDPQAAIVIARENGIALDEWKDLDNTTDNQRKFLNEMRYLRVREWLFDFFWPRPADASAKIREEVIGGTIVEVYTKSSEGTIQGDFDSLKTKV